MILWVLNFHKHSFGRSGDHFWGFFSVVVMLQGFSKFADTSGKALANAVAPFTKANAEEHHLPLTYSTFWLYEKRLNVDKQTLSPPVLGEGTQTAAQVFTVRPFRRWETKTKTNGPPDEPGHPLQTQKLETKSLCLLYLLLWLTCIVVVVVPVDF